MNRKYPLFLALFLVSQAAFAEGVTLLKCDSSVGNTVEITLESEDHVQRVRVLSPSFAEAIHGATPASRTLKNHIRKFIRFDLQNEQFLYLSWSLFLKGYGEAQITNASGARVASYQCKDTTPNVHGEDDFIIPASL